MFNKINLRFLFITIILLCCFSGMRRKSERNKSKASPEKKVEKPTRKSTRRRNRRSPSTSSEKDVEEKIAVPLKEAENETSVQTRLQSKESEQLSQTSEEKVQSSKTEKVAPKDVVDDNCGSVWKVARADASPGEIQKLKLCRQRNISEASSDTAPSGRNSNTKSSGKWQESGEGVAEEADSADEQLVSCTRMLSSPEQPIDPSSSYPGQDSNEEVSDSKEILPETTSANLLSDDKPNIDQHGESNGESNETNCTAQIADSEPGKPSSATATPVPSANGDYTCEKTTVPEVTVQEDKSAEDIDEKSTETLSKETSVDNARRDSSSEEEDDKTKTEPPADSSSDSNDESRTKRGERTSSDRTSPRAIRRKPRNKYRDSSNSETADSEDESVNRKVSETYNEEMEESEEQRRGSEENNKEQSVSQCSITNSEANNVEKMDTEHCETVQDKPEENASEKLEQIAPASTQTVAHKPVKVNLKRSL